jgi:hypothetical protein
MLQQRRRSGLIVGLLSLGLLAGAAFTAPPAQAVDAVGPYYADPAWDQSLPVVTRFVVLTNWASAAVLDKETGLVWERAPLPTEHTWAGARKACTALVTGGRKGWRLPSIPELASLVVPAVPTLPTGHPFLLVQAAHYWSATSSADNPARAWDVHFGFAVVATHDKSGINGFYAWCARGGMNAEAY